MSAPDDDDLPPLDIYLDDDSAQRYSLLAVDLTMILDSGASLPPEEVDDRIFDGTVLGWLEERFGRKLLVSSGYDRAIVSGALRGIAQTHPNSRRRFGVYRNGLCILLAYCLEIMRDPSGYEDPQDNPTFPRA
jgi:hypothetical protein